MKKVLFLFLVITIGTLHGLAQTYFVHTESGLTWNCKVLSDGTASIYFLDGHDEELQELVIPSTVSDASGKTYTVTELYKQEGSGSFASAFANLTKVVLPKSLIRIGEEFGLGTFEDCSKLATVENSENIQSISQNSFEGCTSLTGIKLPQCTSVGSSAFYGCSSLSSIDLPQCTSTGGGAFSGCSSLSSIDLPQCTSIGGGAFSGCSSLSSIDLPQCTSIGGGAFSGCSSLSSINLPQPTSVGNNVFSGCSSLSSIDLSQCTSIGGGAFSGCSSLSSIDLSQCTSIGDGAFSDCSNLSSIDLPQCISIGYSAFSGCSSLACIALPQCTAIRYYAFLGCSNLSSIDLSQCTSVESCAFSGCSSLTNIDLPQCTSVESCAFSGCSSLASINLPQCTSVENSAFSGCSSLASIDLPQCTSVGSSAFSGCSSLSSIDLPQCTSIGYAAFNNCHNLACIDLPQCTSIEEAAFQGCSSLASIVLPQCTSIANKVFTFCSSLVSVTLPKCTSIGDSTFSGLSSLSSIALPQCISIGNTAFQGCSSLSSIALPQCTSIGDNAFSDCSSLSCIDIPQCVTIGNGSFSGCPIRSAILPSSLSEMGNCFGGFIYLTINATTPPAVTARVFPLFNGNCYVKVPDSALDAYRAADGWKSIANYIFPLSEKAEYDVNVTAQESTSGLSDAIGTDHLQKVLRLKVSGTINGYDIMVIRNKMDNLHYLDLSDAEIVENSYKYYTGCSTKHNEIGDHAFDGLTKLYEIVLPKDITSIGNYAFRVCNGLTHISLPSRVKQIGPRAFNGCSNLSSIEFSPVLENIGSEAFEGCSNLKNISLPGTLTHIGDWAFEGCSNLTEVRIPSSLQRIEGYAFDGCPSLQDVYTYTVEPTHIDQTTFSTYATATLHVPEQSFDNYYWNTEWSQFRELKAFDEPYSYFYLNNEYTLASRFKGNPLIDLNPGGGLIVEGEDIQNANNINIMGSAGSDMGTLIANGNVNAENLYFDIRLDANRWYFFCFPFDIKRSNVRVASGTNYVFRRYDGALRAANGSGGWTDLVADDEWLHRGTGYIFQASKGGTLTIKVEKEQLGEYLEADNGEKELATFAAPNSQNASWNFIGNPHTSYFDMNDMGFDAPVTYWNGSTYVAVRPGDDDHIFKPFEAFFVQKPAATASVEFDATKRLTQQGAQKQEEAGRARRLAKGLNAGRLFVNLALTDGQNTDRTRVVYNADRKAEYEADCDAPKFAGATGVPQLYSVESNNLLLAINERPMGSVQLGYVAPTAGDYTLSAARMDQPMLLKDNLLGTTYDLTLGDYTFTTAEGTFNDRFLLMPNKEATGVIDFKSQTGVSVIGTEHGLYISGTRGKTVAVYNTRGQLMATRSCDGLLTLSKGIYVAEAEGMTCKVIVK